MASCAFEARDQLLRVQGQLDEQTKELAYLTNLGADAAVDWLALDRP